MRRPFDMANSAVFGIYAELFQYTGTWFEQLRARLPETEFPLELTAEELQIHIGKVIVTILNRWVVFVQGSRDPHILAEFWGAYLTVDDALERVHSGVQGLRMPPQRILREIEALQQTLRDAYDTAVLVLQGGG